MFNQVADLALGIKEVAELSCTHRADLNTGRVFTRITSDSLDAEGALFNNPFITRPVTEIMSFSI
jgi:hypothetical protein